MDNNQPNDTQALDLTRALGTHESGGNYNQSPETAGQSLGGAYMYQAPTWKLYAKEIMGDENTPFTAENQDKVTYGMVKKWKDAGLQPDQIAHKWNPNDPTYPPKVMAQLKKIVGKSSNSTNQNYQPPTPPGSTPPPQQNINVAGYEPPKPPQITNTGNTDNQPQGEPGLMSKLGGRLNDLGSNITDVATGAIGGQAKQSIPSNIIQGVGAVAGGINDTLTSALEHTPILGEATKGWEDIIGKGVGALASTGAGQEVVKGIQGFQQTHPEIAKDIGAGVDIATTIPILKGLGIAKDIAFTGARGVLGKVLEEKAISQAENELTSTISTATGKKALAQATARGLKPMRILGSMAIPVEDGKYVAGKEIVDRLDTAISDIEENVLQPALEGVSTPQIAQRASMEDIKNELLKSAEDEMAGSGKLASTNKTIENIINENKLKFGDYPSLKDIIDMKRRIAKEISEAGFNSPDYSVNKVIRNGLQDYSEKMAKIVGLEDVVSPSNKAMSELINAQKMLKYIDGKKAIVGRFGKILRGITTTGGGAVGEGIGNAVGMPFVGTGVGAGLGNMAGKAVEKKTAGGLLRGLIKPKI